MNMPLPPIEELLPHRGIMLMLDRAIDFENDSTITEYSPRKGAWYCDDADNMPAWIGIELMAQSAAVHINLKKRSANAPAKHGALLGTSKYHATVPSFTCGVKLRIHVSMTYHDVSGLGAYDCRIFYNDKEQPVATAVLKVYEPEDFLEFLQRSRS